MRDFCAAAAAGAKRREADSRALKGGPTILRIKS
jgi:hypothetical protein